ncbi:hypothetical protein POM88_038437 [Heracleum sosnowskyi]|uniref:Uncharacterized protein n=1 Tax=Heracleum sosnowskyi TaxID=360622 RepID=A0AAD8HAC9_9APIA|nr:hypothetical protein POM88_038437 [Heracleum sosnowskyi]
MKKLNRNFLALKCVYIYSTSVDQDVNTFMDTVKFVNFEKFDSADAAKQIKAFSQGQMTAQLRKFLLTNLPEVVDGKEINFSLGVANPELGYNIHDATKIPCQISGFVSELLQDVGKLFDSYVENNDVLKVDPGNLDNEVAGGNEDVNEAAAKSSANKESSKVKIGC